MPQDSRTSPLSARRVRARELGISPGILAPGPLNAITDVAEVLVGHGTLRERQELCTGATAILPHRGNLYQERVPAGLAVCNGFGKLAGATQIEELGELETPIVLTNTLAVSEAIAAIVDWTLAQPGNEEVRSVNAVVGETNDGYLNQIRRRAPTADIVRQAIEHATAGPAPEGAVGAGTGTVAFGWKGGIGTSSRLLPPALGGYTLGVLVQSNYGGVLQIDGLPVGRLLGRYYLQQALENASADGSIVIILATDAPLSDRNLTRLARRAFAGLARTGASLSNGSGDYAIAFSTAEGARRTAERRSVVSSYVEVPNDLISPLFQAAIEATEEAIYNSLLMAETTTGLAGRTVEALPIEQLRQLLRSRGSAQGDLA